MFLVVDGQAAVSIVLRTDASPEEVLAAREVQTRIARATGAIIPLGSMKNLPSHPLLWLKYPVTAKLAQHPEFPVDIPGQEWFCLRVDAEQAVIWASSGSMLLHSVYELLQECLDIVWASPKSLTDWKQKRSTVWLDERDTSVCSPAFSCRALTNYSPFTEQTADFLAWMSAVGLNRLVVNLRMQDSLQVWQKLIGAGQSYRSVFIEGGHHSFAYWLPPSLHFTSRPDLFALVRGQRVPDGQLCLSNPDTVHLVAQAICRTVDTNPFLKMVSLWPNDGFRWCECPGCQALDEGKTGPLWPEFQVTSSAYLWFANQVATQVATCHPHLKIDLLAYLNYIEPPSVIEAHPNLTLTFAPFKRCLRHVISDPGCPYNAIYRTLLETWRARWPNELRVFEYYLLPDHWSVFYPLWETMAGDLTYYHSIGVDGLVIEYRPEEWDIFGLLAYVYARLLWNFEQPVSKLISNFCRGYYGEAAAIMEEFLTTWSRDVRRNENCFCHLDPQSLDVFSKEALKRGRHLLAVAEQSTNSQLVQQRIRNMRRALHHIAMLQKVFTYNNAVQRAKATGRIKEARNAAQQALGHYDRLLKHSGRLATSGFLYYPRIKEWVDEAKQVCEVILGHDIY